MAEVIRNCRDAFLERYGPGPGPEQRHGLTACRTATRGGHVLGCSGCGHQEVSHNSCGNRHCPKCQATAPARWLEAQAADLLDTPYFHVVFSLPGGLAPLASTNPRVAYDHLMRAAAATVLGVATDPVHLGAEIGVLAVLRTWGQALTPHPHAHLRRHRRGALSRRPSLGRLPGRLLLAGPRPQPRVPGQGPGRLRASFKRGRLRFPGRLASHAHPRCFDRLIAAAARTDWVVYARPPFGGPATVLKSLARYTHRAAISNRRLVDLADGRVSFTWKDYARGAGGGR